jgi:hypothetical protein
MSSNALDVQKRLDSKKRAKRYQYAEWFGPDGDSENFLDWYPNQATIKRATGL